MTVRGAVRLPLAGLLGAGCSLLVACGGGKSLIPAGSAGPLAGDFDAIATAVGNGDCAATRRALSRAQHDLDTLPSSVDAGLRQRISDGLNNLQRTAPTQCAQSQTQSTQTTTTQTTTTPSTSAATTTPPPSTSQTTTTPPPTDTATSPTTSTGNTVTTTNPTQTTGPGGGTPAPQGGNGAGGAGAAGGSGQ